MMTRAESRQVVVGGDHEGAGNGLGRQENWPPPQGGGGVWGLRGSVRAKGRGWKGVGRGVHWLVPSRQEWGRDLCVQIKGSP